jgi:hypothetical protein
MSKILCKALGFDGIFFFGFRDTKKAMHEKTMYRSQHGRIELCSFAKVDNLSHWRDHKEKSKHMILLRHLLTKGSLSRTDTLRGFPVSTNRLAAYIQNFKDEYGMDFNVERTKKTEGGIRYNDTVYTLT